MKQAQSPPRDQGEPRKKRPPFTAEQRAEVNECGADRIPTLGLSKATHAERAELDGVARRDRPIIDRATRRGIKPLTPAMKRFLAAHTRPADHHRPASSGRPAARASRRTHTTRGSPDDDPGGEDPEPVARRAATGSRQLPARHRQPLPEWFGRRYGDRSPRGQLAAYLALPPVDAERFADCILDSAEASRTVKIGAVCGLRAAGAIIDGYIAELAGVS
jgi:hypothetical protein